MGVKYPILMWHTSLGGHVEKETFWVVEKSYAVASLSFLPTYSMFCVSAIHWKPSLPPVYKSY